MKLRFVLLLLTLSICCGSMLCVSAAWAQDVPQPNPVIRHPDRYDQDLNGIVDALDDLIGEAMVSGQAWEERVVVVTLWEPCSDWHLAQARLVGGRIGFIYTHVSYGFSARLPVWAIRHLARNLGDSLCLIESPTRGGLSMDVASKIVRVDPIVWDSYCFKGDPWSSVAVIDTGIDTAHDDLGDDGDNQANDPDDWYDVYAVEPGDWDFDDADRPHWQYKVVGWWDYEEYWNEGNYNPVANPLDTSGSGHGTHVSGILSGFGHVNGDYKGIAPKTRLVGARFMFDETGGGYYDKWFAEAVECMDEITSQCVNYRIKVCNMSWYFHGDESPSLSDKADAMAWSGIVPVVSAGNYFEPGDQEYVYDPGRSEKAITVGATNDNDEVTSYSVSSHPDDPIKPDIVAPGGAGGNWQNGANIMSCDNQNDDGQDDDYQELRGTSMAAPIVAGTAALVIQALAMTGTNWNWGIDSARKVKSLILMTAWEVQRGETQGRTPPLNRGGKDNIEGYGRVCPDAAVEAASMRYTVGLTVRSTLGSQPSDKHVWARKLDWYPNNEDCTLRLTMPASRDADLYVYRKTSDEHGEPVILYSSTSEDLGQTDVVVRPGGGQDTSVYVVVKDASPPPAPNTAYRFDFNLESGTASNRDDVWIKDSDGDDGTVLCLKRAQCGTPVAIMRPVTPDIRTDPDPPILNQSCDIYVTIRNKTNQDITDGQVDVYLYEPTTSAYVDTTGATLSWTQTDVSVPANGSTEIGPFVWNQVQKNSNGEAYWYIGAVVSTPRDGLRLGGSVFGEDNVTAKRVNPESGIVATDPATPGFGGHFNAGNTLNAPASMVLTATLLDIPPEWTFYIDPPLDTPIHLDPGQEVTGEVYLWMPVTTPMGIRGEMQFASALIPDDNSADYDLFGSMSMVICTNEQFADGDMSDWVVDAQGASVFLDTGNYSAEPASMRIEGSPEDGDYASCTSPPVDANFTKPYRLTFSLFWNDFYEAKLVEFGHIRLLARGPSLPLEYDPDGDWQGTVPIGPAFNSMLPPGVWGKVMIAVNPAMFSYTIWVNDVEVGTAVYDRWLAPVDRFHIEDQPIPGSFLAVNCDEIEPVTGPQTLPPPTNRTTAPEDWINPWWNMVSIPLDPAASWDAAHIFGFDPTSHLFAWDKFGKTTTYYGVHFTQMMPGDGYRFYTESEVDPPTYLGDPTHRPFKIALPRMGWAWIGCPSDAAIPLAECEIRNEATGATRMLADDRFAADPWMSWALFWWDSSRETWSFAGAIDFPGIDDSLRPWRGYMAWTNTDEVTLIIP